MLLASGDVCTLLPGWAQYEMSWSHPPATAMPSRLRQTAFSKTVIKNKSLLPHVVSVKHFAHSSENVTNAQSPKNTLSSPMKVCTDWTKVRAPNHLSQGALCRDSGQPGRRKLCEISCGNRK